EQNQSRHPARCTVGAQSRASDRDRRMEAAPLEPGDGPEEHGEDQHAETHDAGRNEPRRRTTGGNPIEHHERRDEIEAPANDLTILDLRCEVLMTVLLL